MLALLRSPCLASPHGFSMRAGGVSDGPFASLNTSYAVGDAASAVQENLARLAAAAGVTPGALATVTQVHGVTVVEARPGASLEADAQWTSAPGVAVGVRTADCVPILLEDPVGRRVAAVHAGWRGVLGGVLPRTIEALEAQGTRRSDLRLAIGPCARACCFEVDAALAEQFTASFGPQVLRAIPGKAKVHLDLPGALLVSLQRLGIAEAQRDVLDACTMCDRRFYSHRRDGGLTGRHLSFIVCRAEAPEPRSRPFS